MPDRKKLIEVALPLDAINAEAAREKSIRHGHPSTLHLWWARRPLAACRAVLFASLVDDPGNDLPDKEAEIERKRLFGILEQLVLWENVNNERVLHTARTEIARSVARAAGVTLPAGELTPVQVHEILEKYAPPVLDPFAGGGSIPLEAQRLGLKAYASDLNPVAVLINKALIEIPPKFAGKPPVHPGGAQHAFAPTHKKGEASLWKGAAGLAEDVRYYGAWMREEAEKRIGHLYPKYVPQTPPSPDPFPQKGGRGEKHEGEGESDQEQWDVPESLRRKMVEVAREFRKTPTTSEDLLWQSLRGKKLEGRKFRRQQPIGPFVVDFFCAAERLIVEVDGPIHASQIEADRQRQALLESLGLRFVRPTADQVEHHLPDALHLIQQAYGAFSLLPLNSEASTPLPPTVGEGAGGRGGETVIAWLWARTVKCPNPACGAMMPLVRSFALSTKKGKETWVEPQIDKHNKTVTFKIKSGKGKLPESPKIGRGAKFKCLVCNQAAEDEHIKSEGRAGRMHTQLMTIVTEGQRGRNYYAPNSEHEMLARSAQPEWMPDAPIGDDRRSMFTPLYGLTHFQHLFTLRQLTALSTFSDLVGDARKQVKRDAVATGLSDSEAQTYADAVVTYLAFAVDRLTNYATTICTWHSGVKYETLTSTFGRQALPMTWDFAEGNPFSESSGNFESQIEGITANIAVFPANQTQAGQATQSDAVQFLAQASCVISTDPPYYDNIGYADLSDFFYVWLRRSLGKVYPNLFSTLLVPKAQELVAAPHRHNGDKTKSEKFFEEGLGKAFAQMHASQHPVYPLTVYYAFKQSESDEDNDGSKDDGQVVASTGWETMLEGLIKAGFAITGTWPMRTELIGNLKKNVGALASSIVLVCRPRPESASLATRREFVNALKKELPAALIKLMHGGIAPVDLAQASIGPGMAVFSRYAKVLEADGTPMGVRTALQLINQHLDEYLTAEDSDLDKDTRFALAWFQQFGHDEGAFGDADVLARAKDTAVAGLVQAGILYSKAGKVRLLRREELAPSSPRPPSPTGEEGGTTPLSRSGRGAGGEDDWDPRSDARLTVWECAQQLIRRLNEKGETGAAALVKQLGGGRSEDARALAYRLYALCERKKWADEALAYNALVVSWGEIEKKAASMNAEKDREQGRLL